MSSLTIYSKWRLTIIIYYDKTMSKNILESLILKATVAQVTRHDCNLTILCDGHDRLSVPSALWQDVLTRSSDIRLISRMNELRSSDQVILTAITSFSEVEPIPQDTLLYYYARRKGLELRRIVGCYVGRYAGGYTEGLRVLVPKGWPTISLYYAFDHSDSYYPVIISSGLATISDQWDVTFPVSSESDLHLAINEIEEYLTEYGAMFAFDLGGIYTPRGVI